MFVVFHSRRIRFCLNRYCPQGTILRYARTRRNSIPGIGPCHWSISIYDPIKKRKSAYSILKIAKLRSLTGNCKHVGELVFLFIAPSLILPVHSVIQPLGIIQEADKTLRQAVSCRSEGNVANHTFNLATVEYPII